MNRLLPIFLLPAVLLQAQQSSDEFKVTEKYYEDSLGSRLVVRPVAAPSSAVGDLELRITDETVFDPNQSEFVRREIAIIQGGGLSSPGLLFRTEDPKFQEEMIQLLELFLERTRNFSQTEDDIRQLEEPWMGNSEAALSQSKPFGTIETDFMRRPAEITLNWSLSENRQWISLNDFINIDKEIAEPLMRLIQHIPTYSRNRQEYRARISEINQDIQESLSASD